MDPYQKRFETYYDAYDEKIEPLVFSTLLSENSTYWQLRLMMRELHKTVFENVEKGITHNPYSHEYRECACIRQGDVEGLRLVLQERFPGRYGKVAATPLRQEINLGIVVVTLASRAAIEGGLHYETAFYLSDICLQKLDACKTPAEAESIYLGAQILYAELVHELLENRDTPALPKENRHVSRCKDYIFAHLYGKLTVREIADAVGLDANYLSTLFRNCENISLKQFILNEKIRIVKHMLTYSDYSYSQIAANLGFSSQSHMGAEFRKVTGMTPRAYREAYSTDDFVRDSMEKK